MFRLRADEDVHVDVVRGSMLRVRRLSGSVQRWEHSLDLADVYADRFTDPAAHVIDGWFGGAGELRLIVHVRDPGSRLLPPRELTFAADAPRLERSRPGAARYTLASRPLRTHVWSGMTLQLVQELDDHVLAVFGVTVARRLGWSIADLPETGYRWFERSEIGGLAALPAIRRDCPICASLPTWGIEHAHGMNPIGVDREHGQSRRTVECHRCLTSWQIDEVIEQGTMKQLWKWERLEGRRRP